MAERGAAGGPQHACRPARRASSPTGPAFRRAGSSRTPSSCARAPPSRTSSIRRGSSSATSRTPTPRPSTSSPSLFSIFAAPVLIVDVAAAELIKNGANAFLALKLSFANEMAGLAEEYGTDIDQVIAGIALDPRIGSQYMRPGLGFGGSCLPKELVRARGGRRGPRPADARHARGVGRQCRPAASASPTASMRPLDGVRGRTRRACSASRSRPAPTTCAIPRPSALHASCWRAVRGCGRSTRRPAENAARELPDLEIAASAEAALDGADVAVIATEWPAVQVARLGGRPRSTPAARSSSTDGGCSTTAG